MATAVLHKGKEQRVYGGHPWVFLSDIDRVEGKTPLAAWSASTVHAGSF